MTRACVLTLLAVIGFYLTFAAPDLVISYLFGMFIFDFAAQAVEKRKV